MIYERETFISLTNEGVIKFNLDLSVESVLEAGNDIDLNSCEAQKQIEGEVTRMFCRIQNNFNLLIKENEE